MIKKYKIDYTGYMDMIMKSKTYPTIDLDPILIIIIIVIIFLIFQ